MEKIGNKESLRNSMFTAQKEQKKLIKKRDLILSDKKSNENALQVTHEIAKLEDFIRMSENNLKMLD